MRGTRISPRYPESISPGVLTSEMPCFTASPLRGNTSPAYPTGMATETPVLTGALSPGGKLRFSTEHRSYPASPACARVGTRAFPETRRKGTFKELLRLGWGGKNT